MKQVLVALALVTVGSVLAHLHVASQTYHPVTRVASPDGLVFTAVQVATPERRACGAANDRFLAPVKALCAQCKVMVARCERELEPFEAAVFQGKAAAHYLVSATGLQLAIQGPEPTARESCELMAGTLKKMGVANALCTFPASENKKAS
jgi:hypothetical protein